MNTSRSSLALLVILVVLLTSAGRCGSPQTVDEVAASLAKSTKYSKPQLANALKQANNGKTTLIDDAAKGLDTSGAIEKVMDSRKEVADAACLAFKADLPTALDEQANPLLSKMKEDVSVGKATKESITLACDIKEILSSFWCSSWRTQTAQCRYCG